jgi:hypothetical protein
MKKRYTFIYTLVALVVTLPGCREMDIDTYENDPRLYFHRDVNTSRQRDSISYSFFIQGETVVRDTVWVEIRTMGIPSATPRPFKVEQINAGDTLAARVGIHYLPFDSGELKELMQVAPGATSALVPVVLLRDISLKREEARLEIAIVENEYFKPGVESNLKFVVKSSDFAVKPASWNLWGVVFNEWGPQKMLFLIQYLGIDFSEPAPTDIDPRLHYRGLAKELLMRYNDTHPGKPLAEEDGTLVSFD